MEQKEAIELLEKQFEVLAKTSETCEDEYLKDITDSMLSIYATLYPAQY